MKGLGCWNRIKFNLRAAAAILKRENTVTLLVTENDRCEKFDLISGSLATKESVSIIISLGFDIFFES